MRALTTPGPSRTTSDRCRGASQWLTVALTTTVMCAMASGELWAQTQLTGQTKGGAYYNIMVLDGWKPAGGLMIWNHGYSLSPIAPDPDLGPLAAEQLAAGFAVAASSYRQIGWALFDSADDLRLLYKKFVAEVGKPDEVFVYGESLGGIVTAQAIEAGGIGNVVAAMPMCGAVAGSRLWDSGIDMRLLYDVLCQDVTGGAIPGGAKGLPPNSTLDGAALVQAVNACMGVVLPAANRTPQQQANLDQFLATSTVSESFVLNAMGFATLGIADLVYDPRKMGGAVPFDNTDVDYGDAAINDGIERVRGKTKARDKFRDNYTPTGNVGDVKIVSLHTDKDDFMVVENNSDYASKVPEDQFVAAVVNEQFPSHCGFNHAEVLGGWNRLLAWTVGGKQPTVAKIQRACKAARRLDGTQGPCRFNKNYVIGDLDTRILPR